MPLPDPDAMDTQADRSRSNKNNWHTKGRTSTTTPDTETMRKEGRCFTCQKQGHLAKNCPDKAKNKAKTPAKARVVEVEDSDDDKTSETSVEEPLTWDAYFRMGRTLPEEDKIMIVRKAAEAQEGLGAPEMDF